MHSKATASQLKPVDHDRLSELAGGLTWRLWHGRAAQARRRLEAMLHVVGRPAVACRAAVPLIRKLTIELLGYLRNNSDSLPDYGRRYRAGQRISSAFVESAVNQLIDKRMSKSQQMRWDPQSATCCCRCGYVSSTVSCVMISHAGTPGSRLTRQRCKRQLDPIKSNALISDGTQGQHWCGGGVDRSLILLVFLFTSQRGIVAFH
ncbi:hypothetical protein LP417_22240 [Polaromonas sp. P1-6]|nr:hypothetical protein LP417_22240 [Polaromonas sp. P1-6]